MQDPTDIKQDGKLDLVPMIDCIMLLLLFFILTTKFTAEEKTLAALLPTNKGQLNNPVKTEVKPPTDINVAAYPEGLSRDLQPSQYQAQLERLASHRGEIAATAMVRIGGSQPLRMDVAILAGRDQTAMAAHLAEIHAYVAAELTQRETTGARQEQPPITIHCFSGLPWKYAAVLYDAVRAYEQGKGAPQIAAADQLSDQRPVSFAPPRLRNYTTKELGEEVYEILNLH